jgi:hypothetical protein
MTSTLPQTTVSLHRANTVVAVGEQDFSIGDSKFAVADFLFPVGNLDIAEKIVEFCRCR